MTAEAITTCPETNSFLDREENRWEAEEAFDKGNTRPPGILVVDDDTAARDLLNIVLREQGFAVWLAGDGYHALKKYRDHHDDIDLVLLDVQMPRLDGPQTLAILQHFNPQVRCWFMTGDLGRYTEEDLMERGAERIIHKPFRVAEMAGILRKLLDDSAAADPGVARADARDATASTDWQLFDGRLL